MSDNAADRPRGADPHPDTETLACLAEDLLTPAEATLVRSHLAGCAHCQRAQLRVVELSATVTELLASAPTEAMPNLVADRLDAALAALDAADGSRSDAAPVADPVAADPVTPELATVLPLNRARPRRRGLLLVVAASTLVIAGAAAGLSTMTGGGTPQAQAPPNPRPAATQGAPTRPPGGGQFASALPYRLSSSGYSYEPDEFGMAVDKLLATGAPTGDGTGSGTIGPKTDPGGGSPRAGQATPSVPACVLDAPRRTDQPLAVDFGSFQGQRVAVLAYADRANKDRVRAFVVAVGCGGVLFEQDVAR